MADGPIKNIWRRFWRRSHEVAAHTALTALILICVFLIQTLNTYLQPPNGILLFGNTGSVPLSYGLDFIDVCMVAYFAYNFFIILQRADRDE